MDIKQIEFFKNVIIEQSNNTYFKVLDFEAGTGKSRELERIIAEDTTDKKYLVVKNRISEAEETCNNINKLKGNNIALSITSKSHNALDFNKIKNKIKEYKVIVITHSKYLKLATNSVERRYFTNNRDVLVIDEFLNTSQTISINIEFIEEFETILSKRALRDVWREIVAELEDFLISDKNKHSFFNYKGNVQDKIKLINKLKALINTNLTSEYLESVGYSKKSINEKLDTLKEYLKKTCVRNNKFLYTSKDINYFLLNNNVMLDASAKLNYIYKINPLFMVQEQTFYADHKGWIFDIYNTNTTKSAKGKAVNLYEVINNKINSQGGENTLYIGTVEDEKHITSTQYKNHFGNITGSNEYRNLKNIVIAHTQNYIYDEYIIQYIHHSNKRLDNRTKIGGVCVGTGSNKVYRFCNEEFEKLRQSIIADQTYQAIKRINRNMAHDSKVTLYCNDNEVINKLLKMFKGLTNINTHENEVEFEKTKMDTYNTQRAEGRQAIKFITLLEEIKKGKHLDLQATKKNRKGETEILKGVYKKSVLREYMGIKDKTQFTHKILNDADVINYFNKHNISVTGQTISFNM